MFLAYEQYIPPQAVVNTALIAAAPPRGLLPTMALVYGLSNLCNK